MASCDDYGHIGSVAQSGDLICVIKERYSAEYKVSRPLTKGELFVWGREFKPTGINDFVVRGCTAINDQVMSLKTDAGVFFWRTEGSEHLLQPLQISDGNLSNDLKWLVTQESRFDVLTGAEIKFAKKLPAGFLGNSPDWKTVITVGPELIERDLLGLHIVDVESGASTERYLRRSEYLFMLDHSHQLAGVVASHLWISNQFKWAKDKDGRDRLVYPVFEPEGIEKVK